MIKVVKDFLPKIIFKYILDIVEHEKFDWNWQSNTVYNPESYKFDNIEPKTGDGKFKLGKTIYTHPSLNPSGQGYGDNALMPLFGMFVELQNQHQERRSEHLLKMKLNLYPNEGKHQHHGAHKDIIDRELRDDVVDQMVMTSVYNFHTCNGYTMIGDEKFPSIANQIVMFTPQAEHYGVTQTDTPRRIILNMNVKLNEKTNK